MEIIGTYRNLVNLFGFQGFCLKFIISFFLQRILKFQKSLFIFSIAFVLLFFCTQQQEQRQQQ